MSDIVTDLPLSVESALSVRQAAIAIRYHGVEYLPVVDDGRLVGIVAFREQPRRRRDPDLGQTDTPAARAHPQHNSDLVVRGGPVRIPARDLVVGDVLDINDWHLHVINIERDQATAVLTAELAFLIHFAHEDLVTVLARVDAA